MTGAYEECRRVWKVAHMYSMAEFREKRQEKRQRWFGRVQMRDNDGAMRNISHTAVYGGRNRGRPKL